MTDAISVVAFRDHTGEVLDRVQSGRRYIIHRFSRPVAALVSIADLQRLEDTMSEDPVLSLEDIRIRERAATASALAELAYDLHLGDKEKAIRALAEAILKVQALP